MCAARGAVKTAPTTVSGRFHGLTARWREDEPSADSGVPPRGYIICQSQGERLTRCSGISGIQITCIKIQCTWIRVCVCVCACWCVCQQTDLQLRLASVDVVSGLVELLQLPLEERERENVMEYLEEEEEVKGATSGMNAELSLSQKCETSIKLMDQLIDNKKAFLNARLRLGELNCDLN